jgi:hypothetical protein
MRGGLPGHAGMAGGTFTPMLTRSGVAKRLGKSMATVRRMEGVELFPTRDERGVNWFEPEEVERVARGDRSLRRAPKPHRIANLEALRANADESDSEPDHDQSWEDWKRERPEQAERRELERERREAREAEERRRHEEELAEQALWRLQIEVCEFIGSLTPREVRRLSEEDLDALIKLLES